MIVRAPRTDELDALGELTATVYVEDGHAGGDYAEQLRDTRRRSEQAEQFVAVDEAGTLLGGVTFAAYGSPWAEISTAGECEIRMLAVRPATRGTGAGTALVQACIDRARQLGARAVVLSTMADMHAAHRIYRRLGFERAPERDWSPLPGVDLLSYAVRLQP